MGHSFVSCLYDCTFSTKDRRPLITADLRIFHGRNRPPEPGHGTGHRRR